MKIPFTSFSYETLLKSITNPQISIPRLHQIHALIITNGFSSKLVLSCKLISSYASLCELQQAQNLFDSLSQRTTHTYNHMLNALINQNKHQAAFELYSSLLSDENVSPDAVTFSIVLKACIVLRLEREGKSIHTHVLLTGSQSDLRLSTDLLHLYLRFGCLDYAKKLFDLMPQKDVFVWTSMIDGLLRSKSYADALKYFQNMRESGFKASGVTWNALISGFAREELYIEAMHYIKLMQLENMKPGSVILSSILPMFAQNALMKPGLEVHGYAIRYGLESDLFVVSSLVDMYAKCGKMPLARFLFDRAKIKDTGLWNAIIVGYGMHGNCKEALSLFDEMIYSNIRPNEITFTAVLSSCSHRGFVSQGLKIFDLMVKDYEIAPRHEHCASIVDLLGRAGRLDEAYEFIRKLSTDPTKDVWGAFLNACRIHSDVKFMEIAAKNFAESGENTGYCVMMSNVYAESGQWGEVMKLRTQMRDGRSKKKTGFSWIEVGDAVHVFSMADFSHPESREIYFVLRNLNADISRMSMS